MSWVYLLVAGVFECVWAVGLKYTEGFSKPIPSIITVVAMIVSVWLLALAMKEIPIGTAYAVWTGIGAVGVAIVGMLLFDESRELVRLFSLMLIITGIVGLKLVSNSGTA